MQVNAAEPTARSEFWRPNPTVEGVVRRAAEPSAARGATLQPNYHECLLTPREASAFLRVSESWLAKARMRGDGPPYVKIGRSIRYAERHLQQWMTSRMHLSTSER